MSQITRREAAFTPELDLEIEFTLDAFEPDEAEAQV